VPVPAQVGEAGADWLVGDDEDGSASREDCALFARLREPVVTGPEEGLGPGGVQRA